uniref:Hexosyltransferase n=1 Tax=Chenopodium quinoa TaxID=63459 RepID=A0A803KP75_CHEQI
MGAFTKPAGLQLPSSICTTSSSRRLVTYRLVLLIFISFPLLLLNVFLPHPQLIDVIFLQTQSITSSFPSPSKVKPPIWLEVILRTHLNPKEPLKVGLVNFKDSEQSHLQLDGIIEYVTIDFESVSPNVTWKKIFPGWINEMNPKEGRCPKTIPMPETGKYLELDVVVACLPCRNDLVKKGKLSHWEEGIRDVRRLQVSLASARVVVDQNHGINKGNNDVYAVFITKCEPMVEIFRCDDLIWHRGEYWVYKPKVEKLKEVVSMPIGSCALARPYARAQGSTHLQNIDQLSKELQMTSPPSTNKPRHAYVTVLHSSEFYVCGAIALAQSILQTNTTKDLVLLADHTISKHSIQGLQAAGWKVRQIDRIRSPNSKVDSYNEWNYSKLSIDRFFDYPQLSAAPNNKWLFNSGIMLLEPSECFFDYLMSKRYTLKSYNGGDQGYLNEIITWWHRLTVKLNFMKYFPKELGDESRFIPKDQHTIHFLGMKPWSCYRDYDCNWHREEYHNFASDEVNARWWQVYDEMPKELQYYCRMSEEADAKLREFKALAEQEKLKDEHWRIEIKDPRQYNLVNYV